MVTIHEFRAELIDILCELGGCTESDAHRLAEEKMSEIEYAHQYRLSPRIIAGYILGINDCCIAAPQIKY